MIFECGSELITHKPLVSSSSDIGETEDDNKGSDERTPHQRTARHQQDDPSEAPYKTPIILRTKPWVPSVVPPDDTEEDNSEIERVHVMNRRKPRVSYGKPLMHVDI